MPDTISAFRLFAASQLIFWIGAILLSANPLRTRTLGAALGAGIVAYLAIPLLDGRVDIRFIPLVALAADAIPALVLLFVWDVFEDESPPRWIWWAAAAYLIVASLFALEWNPLEAPAITALSVFVQLTKLALAGFAIAIIWRGKSYDLLETRLRLRRVAIATLGVIVVSIVFAELVTGWRVPSVVELVGMGVIFAVALSVNLAFLRLNPAFAMFPPAPRPPVQPALSNPLLESLSALMLEERLYTHHDLRIGQVADRLQVPEYKLRRAINQHLGYRNFNQFINEYRVKEAAARLRDGSRTPVLTIAIDAGFRSISSFNAAFRACFGRSPSEYRQSESPPES